MGLLVDAAMLEFPVGGHLLKAAGAQQPIAGDLLEIAHRADRRQVERRDGRRLVSGQHRFVHHVFEDAGQAERGEAGPDRGRAVAEDAGSVPPVCQPISPRRGQIRKSIREIS